METKRIVIKDRKNIKDEELAEAAAVLRSGGLVAFPQRLYTAWAAMPWMKMRPGRFMLPRGAPPTIP